MLKSTYNIDLRAIGVAGVMFSRDFNVWICGDAPHACRWTPDMERINATWRQIYAALRTCEGFLPEGVV